ncbi:RsiV family protein [Acinetobacter sp. UGAL515B_02]|uniref:RsiV family protein n=1 Tax=Acinetobacter soli TaxID=487316 RepID=UPI00046A70EE|nr:MULTISPECIES: RsiV family protein [Acinetobacter]MBV6552361.1 RsiV family protein [Acinetobacter soli]WON79402.1 RsiV family protein [Acinetobacter sp. UGAL515B_02]
MLRFQKNAWIAILGSTLALAACQPKQAAEDAAKAASATDSSTQAQVLAIEGKTVKLNADLPECDGNNCPEFEIERLQSNMPWIDQQIDAEILNNLARILEISKSVKAGDSAAKPETGAASAATGAQPEQITLEQQIKPYVRSFVALDNEMKTLSANHQLNLMIKPSILKSQQPVATIVLNTSSYLGGAHGSAMQEYYNFDLKQQKQLHLNDLLLAKQKVALEKLAHEAFKAWVIESKLATSVDEYEQAWKFKLSDNFLLGDDGLILQYGEYEIGPYAVGLPRLVIPYSQLGGILKPEYLPQAKGQR